MIKKWKCEVCGQIFEGDAPPVPCPVCGAGEDAFVELLEEEKVNYKHTNERFLIIGGGAAALETAKAIRHRNKTANIVMLSEEEYLPYNRPALSDVVGDGLSLAAIELEDMSFYKANDIALLNGVKVTSIDPNKQIVWMDNGGQVPYDKLCFATGATANNPIKMVGNCVPTCVLRKYEDAMKILEQACGKKVAVIGGGILGIEAAVALRERGCSVTVYEMQPYILKAQLDEWTANKVRTVLESKNIKVFTSVNISHIDEDGIVLSDESKENFDYIIVSAGIRPNISVAKEAGILCGRGILVNEQMMTNMPNVYAAGDCAEFEGRIQGLWATAVAQGMVAGANMNGDHDKIYRSIVAATSFEGLSMQFFSAGNVSEEHGETVIHRNDYNEYSQVYRKLIFHEKKLVGAIFFGDTSGSGKVISLIDSQAHLQEAVQVL